MGNSQAKEARSGASRRPSGSRHGILPTAPAGEESSRHGRTNSVVYASRNGRGSRHDLSFLGIGASSERDPVLEPRHETKAEREARRLEKERQLRAQERERSLREEEGVDGGFVVTLGTYTGPEDFNKPVVRQLQIERRLAPFWKGLEEHEDTWTEHQLVAVVNGKDLPAPDEIPPEEPPRPANLSAEWSPQSTTPMTSLTVPIGGRSMSQNSDRSGSLSPSHPVFSLPSLTSPLATPPSSPFSRGRAKTLAALSTHSRNSSHAGMMPQELQLPKDPYINGQRIEVFLYKNPSECPICFLYYPPYLNRTRCCNQPICSECFVQIKRLDPHPPEHHDDDPPSEPQEDNVLVSESACCPFCVQPEFGVTYEPPPFRRGLTYINQRHQSLASTASPMSSTSSLGFQGAVSSVRKRSGSLAPNDSSVITTDRVRPDWAKKLADARAHALRRAVAATALHSAAFMLGNMQSESRGTVLGRRRRSMFGNESVGGVSNDLAPRLDNVHALLAAAAAQGPSNRSEEQNDLTSGRYSSRRGNRLEDLEELMMMEAIRLSLAAEEEREKKEEKESTKEAIKEEKKRAKEAKKAEKIARKSGFYPLSFPDEAGDDAAGPSAATGKGKAVDRSGGHTGFNLLSKPTLSLNASSAKEGSQNHLEQRRAQIQREVSRSGSPAPFDPLCDHPRHGGALPNASNASSSVSSLVESSQGSLRQEDREFIGAHSTSVGLSPNASGMDRSADMTFSQERAGTDTMLSSKSVTNGITKVADTRDKPQLIEEVRDDKKAVRIAKPNAATATDEVPGERLIYGPEIAIPSLEGHQLPKIEPISPLEASVATLKPSASVVIEDKLEPAPPPKSAPGRTDHLEQKHMDEGSTISFMERQQATQ